MQCTRICLKNAPASTRTGLSFAKISRNWEKRQMLEKLQKCTGACQRNAGASLQNPERELSCSVQSPKNRKKENALPAANKQTEWDMREGLTEVSLLFNLN